MGSVRGRLTASLAAATALLPDHASAALCDSLRPGWDGTRVTIRGEALALFTAPAFLFLLAASATAMLLRSAWGAALVCVLRAGLTMLVAASDPGGMRALARAEGCAASPALFIARSRCSARRSCFMQG